MRFRWKVFRVLERYVNLRGTEPNTGRANRGVAAYGKCQAGLHSLAMADVDDSGVECALIPIEYCLAAFMSEADSAGMTKKIIDRALCACPKQTNAEVPRHEYACF